jgi:3-methyl-2-oxobutanoate hydroxymethyltransferase
MITMRRERDYQEQGRYMAKRVTIRDPQRMKRRGEPIAMVTAYDFPTAMLADEAGLPLILVGDSLGMTVHGHETTIPVTLDMMVLHSQAVARGAKRALVVTDLPFLSYQVNPDEALRNAGRLMQEGNAGAVKLEGGKSVAGTISRIVSAGIPVMGHIGLTPQSVHQFGGYRVQARTADSIRSLCEDARALEAAGVFALVLEVVPAPVARLITEILEIPTIGIGAGPDCDGQVQVLSDLLHLLPESVPKHARAYLDLSTQITGALRQYQSDVQSGDFPTEANSFSPAEDIDDATLQRIRDEFSQDD